MKALTISAIAALAVLVSLTATGASQAAEKPARQADVATAQALDPDVWSDIERDVLRLHNQARDNNNKPALRGTDKLGKAANYRCKETTRKWSHTRPNGKQWHTVLPLFDISYNVAGENIARGQTSAQQVHQDWMGSSGHRGNILNGAFDFAGVGHCVSGGTTYWVVLFTG
ncbi:MAG: CAP domain-containing protein [Dehalococcoidia bacterium]